MPDLPATVSLVASPSYVAGLARSGLLRPKRRLGQNFLVDRNVLAHLVHEARPIPPRVPAGEPLPDRLARAPQSGDVLRGASFLEIGAGLGALTLALVEAGASRVVAIEKDRSLGALLTHSLAGLPQVRLEVGDALDMDLRQLAEDEPIVVGNLPYAVTTPLLLHILRPPLFWPKAVVMLQLEVAQRLQAPPGGKDYGAFTLAVAAVATARLAFRVSRRSFYPVPEVDSAVVVLERRTTPAGGLDPAGLLRLSRVVRAAFGQRRKTLTNALAAGLDLDRSEVADIVSAAGIAPGRRGETLSLDEFVTLERVLGPRLRAPGR